jgi:hypothetical protein
MLLQSLDDGIHGGDPLKWNFLTGSRGKPPKGSARLGFFG